MIARNQNRKVKQAFYLLAFAIGMLAMSYAAVPLYKIFCKVTGYGGTPQFNGGNGGSETSVVSSWGTSGKNSNSKGGGNANNDRLYVYMNGS